MSKGSARRPSKVSAREYGRRHEATFGGAQTSAPDPFDGAHVELHHRDESYVVEKAPVETLDEILGEMKSGAGLHRVLAELEAMPPEQLARELQDTRGLELFGPDGVPEDRE